MGDRIFDKVYACGCMECTDPENPGLMPCYAEYGDMSKEENRKALELHNKCMNEDAEEEKAQRIRNAIKKMPFHLQMSKYNYFKKDSRGTIRIYACKGIKH